MELSTTMANMSTATGNESGNITFDDSSRSITPEHILLTYVFPSIIFVGLKGNIVSIIIFLDKELRHISSSVYILAVLCSDTGMLLNQTLSWFDVLQLKLIHKEGICQLFVFSSFVFAFLSEWYMVCITVENYVTLRHPAQIKTLCTIRRALIVTLSLAFFAVSSYSVNLFSKTAVGGNCHTKYKKLEQIYFYMDNIVTLLLPTIVLLFLLAAIVLQVIKSIKTKRRMSMSKSNKKKSSIPQVRVAKMLFVLSLSSFVLSSPDHIFRLYYFLSGINNIPYDLSLAYLVFMFLYYTRFSIKFFILISFSTNFRKKLLAKFKCKRNYYDTVATKPEVHNKATNIPPVK